MATKTKPKTFKLRLSTDKNGPIPKPLEVICREQPDGSNLCYDPADAPTSGSGSKSSKDGEPPKPPQGKKPRRPRLRFKLNK